MRFWHLLALIGLLISFERSQASTAPLKPEDIKRLNLDPDTSRIWVHLPEGDQTALDRRVYMGRLTSTGTHLPVWVFGTSQALFEIHGGYGGTLMPDGDILGLSMTLDGSRERDPIEVTTTSDGQTLSVRQRSGRAIEFKPVSDIDRIGLIHRLSSGEMALVRQGRQAPGAVSALKLFEGPQNIFEVADLHLTALKENRLPTTRLRIPKSSPAASESIVPPSTGRTSASSDSVDGIWQSSDIGYILKDGSGRFAFGEGTGSLRWLKPSSVMSPLTAGYLFSDSKYRDAGLLIQSNNNLILRSAGYHDAVFDPVALESLQGDSLEILEAPLVTKPEALIVLEQGHLIYLAKRGNEIVALLHNAEVVEGVWSEIPVNEPRAVRYENGRLLVSVQLDETSMVRLPNGSALNRRLDLSIGINEATASYSGRGSQSQTLSDLSLPATTMRELVALKIPPQYRVAGGSFASPLSRLKRIEPDSPPDCRTPFKRLGEQP